MALRSPPHHALHDHNAVPRDEYPPCASLPPSRLEPGLPIFKDNAVHWGDTDPLRRHKKHVRHRFGTTSVLRTDHRVKPRQNPNRSQRGFRGDLGTPVATAKGSRR